MTLHWWMHWFWVTAQLAVILASPLPSTTEDPRARGFYRNSTEISKKMQPTIPPSKPRIPIDDSPSTDAPEDGKTSEMTTGATFRIAKAIGFYDLRSRSKNAASGNNKSPVIVEEASELSEAAPLVGETSERYISSTMRPSGRINWNVNGERSRTSPENMIRRVEGFNGTVEAIRTSKRDSRITWVLTTSRPSVRQRTEEIIAEDIIRNFSDVTDNDEKDLTVLPLRLEAARFKLVVNRTRTITANSANGFSTRTINGSEDIEIDQELAEPRLAATAASILQGEISDSTRLSRARNTFSRDFQSDREEDRSSDVDVGDAIVADVSAEIENSTTSAVDIAAITGSCLATVVLLSTMASLGFVMYRRKYLNPPQTLNSDKCSNPDSSGYIDDSTIRDNSEEMYSLDNDSFLNSLEAMTIQNYWTDSVKHTKL